MKAQGETARRRMRGGLDNAVKQAEDRGLYDMLVVDADCHQREAYSQFVDYVKPEYRSALRAKDAKRITPKYKRIIGKRVMRPEVSYPLPMGPEEIVDTFSVRLQEIGITRPVVIPDPMLEMATDPRNPDFEVEVGKGYAHYMADTFGHLHDRFVTVIYAATTAPDKAAELIDDLGSEKIFSGVLISTVTLTNPSSDDWNPIYDAAQRKGLPICVHGDNPGDDGKSRNKSWLPIGFGLETFLENHVLSFPITIARQLTSIVLGGVPVRFPRLKFIFMEGGVTYIPWLMQRMDDEYVKRSFEAPLLNKFPSAYMNEFYYTTQPLESANKFALKNFLNMFDYENRLVYASDYPHWDFDAPSAIYDLPFLSETAKRKILGENAARAFRLS
ncbi:MAG: amidohydrolase [Thaumarchaeota archaeon]|nr:amidohydrolase [Nitrososphaerota archaeon]